MLQHLVNEYQNQKAKPNDEFHTATITTINKTKRITGERAISSPYNVTVKMNFPIINKELVSPTGLILSKKSVMVCCERLMRSREAILSFSSNVMLLD